MAEQTMTKTTAEGKVDAYDAILSVAQLSDGGRELVGRAALILTDPNIPEEKKRQFRTFVSQLAEA